MYGSRKYNDPSYYRPYKSDTEDEDDETRSTDSSSLSSSSSSSFYVSPKDLVKPAGISLTNTTKQLEYGVNKLSRNVDYSFFEGSSNNSSNINYGSTKFASQTNKHESIIVLNSRDRDRQVYSQPTNLVLRLPRIYRNITNLQFSQIKLLSAFYYFRADKGNTKFYIAEQDRTNYNRTFGEPNAFPVRIDQGSYDIDSLIDELNQSLNVYPIFYYFPGGFIEFSQKLNATGDLGVNFNEIGDYFFDIANNAYITIPTLTKTYVTQIYFPNRVSNKTAFTLSELQVAYYYPALKQYLLENPNNSKLNLSISNNSLLLSSETVLSRVLYTFQGLNDPVAYEVIINNITFLDKYRELNTFKYNLVNKYVVGIDKTLNLVTFTSPNLNTSLVNLLTIQYNNYFFLELSRRGIPTDSYTASNSLLIQYNTVLLGMYDFLQTNLAKGFAINYNTYSMRYLVNTEYQIFIRDGANATGIETILSSNVLYSQIPKIDTYSLQNDAPIGGWPALSSGLSNTSNLINSNTQFNHFYSITKNTILNNEFINSCNLFVQTNVKKRAGDIIVPVSAQKYTVIAFKSPVRQTLQVETLSRPVIYRYPAYNSTYNPVDPRTSFFNYSYEFITNCNSDALLPIDLTSVGGTWDTLLTPITGTVFGQDSNTGEANASNFVLPCDPFTYFTSLFYVFTAPYVDGVQSFSEFKKYPVTFTSSGMSESVSAYLYHDRAAMMADVTSGKNNPLHYKIVSQSTERVTINWNAYENNTYYIVVRPTSSPFSRFIITPNIYFPQGSNYISLSTNQYGMDPNVIDLSNFNYAKVYDPDYIRLPITSNLWTIEPTDYAINQPVLNVGPPIGYDESGYSFDLTDYRPCSKLNGQTVITTTVYCDPISPTVSFFSFISPYSKSNQAYFYPESSNSILTMPNLTYKSVPIYTGPREYKLLNWFDSIYIGSNINAGLSNINVIRKKMPFTLGTTSNTPIRGYNYDGASNLSLYDGACGFTFLPDDGIWNLKSLTINTGVMNRSNNSNHLIAYVGIYNTIDVYNEGVYRIPLSSALVVLSLVKRRYYLPGQNNNPGFSNEYEQNSNEYVFDNVSIAYGSYYYFETIGGMSNALEGYTESPRIFLNSPENFYSAITFDAASNVIAISQLAGSLTPYPISSPIVADTYYNGVSPDNGKQLIRPSVPISNVLPYRTDFTQVGYEQSMYFTSTGVHMMNTTQQIYDENALKPWEYRGTAPPTGISANVRNIANTKGYLVINDGIFRMFSYNLDGSRDLSYYGLLTIDTIFSPSTNIRLGAFTTDDVGISFLGFSNNGNSNYIVTRNFGLFTYTLGQINSDIRTIPLSENILQYRSIDTTNFIFTTYSSTDNLYYVYINVSTGCTKYLPSGLNTGLPNNQPIYIDIAVSLEYNTKSVSLLTSNLLYTFSITDTIGGNPIYTLPLTASNYKNIANVVENDILTYYVLATSNSVSHLAKINIDNFGIPVTTQLSYQTFANTPNTLVSGAYGSKWIVNNTAPFIQGNRFILDGTLQTAWQIFYPSYKFIFNKIAAGPIPITDLTNIEPPEYFHTNIFVYNSYSALSNDIGQSWGSEKPANYLCSDTKFRGFQFNSYIENVPLEPDNTYYLAIRGYLPSEQFQTMVRFYLPNRYDFRWVTLADISNEIQINNSYMASCNGLSPFNFNPTYGLALSNFNELFVGAYIFGANIIPGFSGVFYNTHNDVGQVTWAGFADFYDAFIYYYSEYFGLFNLINGILATVTSNLNTFIATDLAGILPPNALRRAKFTDPILYSICFQSGNNYAFGGLEEEWGIGWNLGFLKEDTPFLTKHTAASFYKILDDYVYMRLNEEFNMNRIDTTGKENLQETREPTGMVGQYNMKLLLNNFGGYAQTAIINPVGLNPPLGKLDRISVQILDLAGNVIDNSDCEWNACLQITELIDQPTAGSSLIRYNKPEK